jgi:hypothetical protein
MVHLGWSIWSRYERDRGCGVFIIAVRFFITLFMRLVLTSLTSTAIVIISQFTPRFIALEHLRVVDGWIGVVRDGEVLFRVLLVVWCVSRME